MPPLWNHFAPWLTNTAVSPRLYFTGTHLTVCQRTVSVPTKE